LGLSKISRSQGLEGQPVLAHPQLLARARVAAVETVMGLGVVQVMASRRKWVTGVRGRKEAEWEQSWVYLRNV